MTLTAAQALYRERYAAPLRDSEPDRVTGRTRQRRAEIAVGLEWQS